MTLSIIIVSYNVKCFLEQCLCSVKEAIHNIETEVIVIDNASADDTIPYLQSSFPWVKFIQNKTNDGFAKANNNALEKTIGQYILFLNPDTILAEDTLTRCLSFYKNHIEAGAIGVRMIDGSGIFLPESKRSFPSPLVAFYKLTGLSSLFPQSKRFGKYALSYLSQNDVHEVDVISGAFIMIPKIILDRTGGFDERFFMYAEDIDLSYRVQKQNFRNYYLGDITIIHFKGESTKKGSLNYVRVFYNAMSLFVKKWYPGAGSWLLRKTLQAGIFVRGAASVFVLPFKRKKKNFPLFSNIVLIGDTHNTSLAADIACHYCTGKNVLKLTEAERGELVDSVIVFCIGDSWNYKKSIERIEKQNAYSYKWFGKDSRSIVGSDNKNSSGEVWVKS